MTIEEILSTADLNTRQALASLADAIQEIHAECSAKQALVEQHDEDEVYAAMKAAPPADVPAALVAFGTLLDTVDQKHSELLKEKAEKLHALRAALK